MCKVRIPAAAIAILLIASWSVPLAAETEKKPMGFVDGRRLIEALGDDRVLIEVTLEPWLLRPMLKSDPQLERAAAGLESISALIIDLSDVEVRGRAEKELTAIENQLLRDGWTRLARIQEEGSRIRILVKRAGEEQIGGLTVLMLETEDEPVLIFANIAGVIDLAELQKLGEAMELPGLSDLDLEGMR